MVGGIESSSALVAKYVDWLISVKYFVPVTLIAEIYQPWNLGKCDTSLPLPKTLNVRQTQRCLDEGSPVEPAYGEGVAKAIGISVDELVPTK
jgi:hypothetical protein